MVAARRPPRRWTLAVLLLAFLALVAVGSVARFYTDLLWFREIDKTPLFWGMLRTKFFIGLLAGLGTALIVGVNLWLVERLAPRYGLTVVARPQVERARAVLSPYLRPLRLGIAAFLGLVVGLQASGLWQSFLLWRNRSPFGQRDALFNRDVSFYMFELPFLRAVFGWLFTTLVLTTILVAAGHYVLGGIRPQAETNRVAAQAQSHLSVLLGIIVALKAWGYWLDKYQLLFSSRGVVAGASYTDVKAQLPALEFLFWVALICAAAFFVGARRGGLFIPLISIVLLAGVSLIMGGIVPAIFQRFRVEPQELVRERPYIERNIDATRKAFNLNNVSTKDFPASEDLDQEAIDANGPTIENIRLWDPEVLRPGVRNLQAIAQYYNFTDVDVDRYPIDGNRRQVMISVREVDPNGLAESARTWQNLHLAYTHGYGMVAVQVNTAAEGGQPDFIVSGFNPEDPKIQVDEPRVYFGEPPPNSPEFVVANSAQGEYDAQGSGDTTRLFNYTGDGGVQLSDIGRRLAFAVRFRDINLLISGNIKSGSRLMFNRDIRDRVEKAAPFLQWDGDPYAVVVDGRIKYVRDGYTTSSNYPYAQRIDLADAARRNELGSRGVESIGNYLRNSVKAVVDAYTGEVTLYAFDEQDPILKAWRKAFPNLFAPASDIPDSLRQHLRYPEDLFSIQTWIYASYHIGNPDDFYSKEDFWALPDDRSGEIRREDETGGLAAVASVKARPYYLLTKLPERTAPDPEYVLVMPFTPNGKENMVSYLAAEADPAEYGKLTLYSLPRSRTILGPTQVNARILATSEVASELTLLDQRGSRVILSNLLVVPVDESLLYVQPIFVQGSAPNSFPLLQKVAVFYNNQVGYAPTLGAAIQQVIGGEQPTPPDDGGAGTPPPPTPGGGASDDVQSLLRQANNEYEAAQRALADGNLAEYQRHIDTMARLLQQALEAQGDGGSSPTTTTRG
ncbi:MAG TPA: UPF0182 family protein [Actinomycetota bacterium]|nr:UPF0182 family protein [Actinomycetota bacterium]